MSVLESVNSIQFTTLPSGNLQNIKTLSNTSFPKLKWSKNGDLVYLNVMVNALNSENEVVNDYTNYYLIEECLQNPSGQCFNWEYKPQNAASWSGITSVKGQSNLSSILFHYDITYPNIYNDYRCVVNIDDPTGEIETTHTLTSNTVRIHSAPHSSFALITPKFSLLTYRHTIDLDYTEIPDIMKNIVSIRDYANNIVLVQGIYLSQYPNQFNKSEFAPLTIEQAQIVAENWNTNGPGLYHYRANSIFYPGKRPPLDTSNNPTKTFRFNNNTESRPIKNYVIESAINSQFMIEWPSHKTADGIVPSGGEITSTITAAITSGDYIVYTSNHSFTDGSFVNVSGLTNGWNTSDMTSLNSVWIAQSGSGYFSVPNFSNVTGSLSSVSGTARLRTISVSSSGNFGFGIQFRSSGDPLNSDDPNIYWQYNTWSYDVVGTSSIVAITDPFYNIPITGIYNIEQVDYITTSDGVWKQNYSLSTFEELEFSKIYTIVSTGNLPFTLSYPPPASGDYLAISCVDNSEYRVDDPEGNLVFSGPSGIYYVVTTTTSGCYAISEPTGLLSNSLGDITSATLQFSCETCGP